MSSLFAPRTIRDPYIEPSERLIDMVSVEHDRIEEGQRSPWLAEAEKRYAGKGMPDSPRGSENREAWEHIRRHLALQSGNLRLSMIPPHWLPILRREEAPRPRIIARPRPPPAPEGSEPVRALGRVIYRFRRTVEGRVRNEYYSDRVLLFYSQQVIVPAHTVLAHYRLVTPTRKILIHSFTVPSRRYLRYRNTQGRFMQNPFKE